MKFFLYARKSSEAEERQAMSIEAQLFELPEFAKHKKIEIAERFVESRSAKQPGRPEFNRMIAKIYESKEPVGILAWHPDRLARNSVDGGQIIYLIDIKKIGAVCFPTFWFEPTSQGLLMLNNAFAQSKYYSDNLSENVRRGNRQKIRRGEYNGVAPLGYTNNYKTKNIERDPVKAKIVQQLFKEYAQGKHTLDSLRERLKLWGVVNYKGKLVARSYVRRILSNRAYLGILMVKGEAYTGNFEPLIDNATFEAVQRILKGRSRPRKRKKAHDFPFLGLIKCGECGGAITAQFAKGNGGLYRYYRCSKRMGRKCGQGYLREDRFVNAIEEQLLKVALPDEITEKMLAQIDVWGKQEEKKMLSFAQKIEDEIKDNEQKLDKLVNAFLESLIDQQAYLKKKEELIKTKADLNQRKSNFGQKGAFWIEPLKDWVKASNGAGKSVLAKDFNQMKLLIEKIGTNRVLKDKKIVFDFVEPFDKVAISKASNETSPDCSGLVLKGENELTPFWCG